MATAQGTRSRVDGNGSAPAGLRLARPRERRTPWIVLGVLVIAGSALAFGTWSSSLGERELVVVAARDIQQGATVTADDVRAVRVALDGGATAIPAGNLRSLVGRVVATPVARGAIVHPSQLADGPILGNGEAVVGVALAPGAVPTETLRVGDRVQVVEVSQPNGSNRSAGGRVLGVAHVFALRELDDTSRNVVVSLRVAATDATAIADAAGADRVRLVLLGATKQ